MNFKSILVLDKTVIDELRELDEEVVESFLDNLVHLFLKSVPISIEKMKSAYLQLDYKLIANEVHNIVSSSGNLGAMRISFIASKLEQSSHANEYENVGILLSEIEKEFQEAKTELLKVLA